MNPSCSKRFNKYQQFDLHTLSRLPKARNFSRFIRNSILLDNRGFTLLELMVSIFIISVILAIAIPNLRGSGEKAQKTACQSDQMLIRAALDSYWVENHSYPTGTADDVLNSLVAGKYLQSVPKEPSGGQFVISSSSGDAPTVSCTVHGELGV